MMLRSLDLVEPADPATAQEVCTQVIRAVPGAPVASPDTRLCTFRPVAGSAALHITRSGRRWTVMRHFLCQGRSPSGSPSTISRHALGMPAPAPIALLVAPARLALLDAPRRPGAAAGAIDLPAVAVAADHGLTPAAHAVEQPRRSSSLASPRPWTSATAEGRTPPHPCSLHDVGHGTASTRNWGGAVPASSAAPLSPQSASRHRRYCKLIRSPGRAR